MTGIRFLGMTALLVELACLTACNQKSDHSREEISARIAAQNDQNNSTIPLGMDFSPSSSRLVFVHGASPATVIDLAGREPPHNLSISFPSTPNRILQAYINGNWLKTPRVQFIDEERIMVAASVAIEGIAVPIWKVQFTEWDIVEDRELSSREFDNVINWCFGREGSRVALLVRPANKPMHILLWDLDKQLIEIPYPTMHVPGIPIMALSADGSVLSLNNKSGESGRFAIEPDGKLRLVEKSTHVEAFDYDSGSRLETYFIPGAQTPSFRIIKNGGADTIDLESSSDEPKNWCHFFAEGRYVTAALGQAVHVWNAVDGQHLAEYQIPWRQVVNLRGSRVGDYVAIGIPEGIVIWNPHDGSVKNYPVGK